MPEMVFLWKEFWLTEWSYADFAQIFTIDKERLLSKIGKINSKHWGNVKEALETIFMKTIK